MANWQVVGTLGELDPASPKVIDYNGRQVALFLLDDRIYAIDNLCSHQGAPLSEQGIVNTAKKEIACTWHGRRFSLESGKCSNIPGMKTNCYEVQVEDGVISITSPRNDDDAQNSYETKTDQDKDLLQKVQNVMDTLINPGVASHGGVIRLLDLRDHTVYVEMGGGCQGCGQASATLKQGVEKMIKQHVPEIKKVLDVTDHAAGSNPYYRD